MKQKLKPLYFLAKDQKEANSRRKLCMCMIAIQATMKMWENPQQESDQQSTQCEKILKSVDFTTQ